jgi:carboxymethylenebutenolidase
MPENRALKESVPMCFDTDSHPPIEPIAGGALDSERVTLTSADGTPFSAFKARAATPSGNGILILPDVRGLHAYYEELSLRFAEHGIDAVAIDYFGRTAGLAPRPADFDHAPHVGQTSWEAIEADIRAGAESLRSIRGEGSGPSRIFSIGFCMGGRLASLAGTLGLGFSGLIAFYGWPTGPHRSGSPAPAEVAATIEAPVLAIYGGADQGITADVRSAYEAALDAAGIKYKTIVYPGAPHSFFDRKAEEFAAASEAAWAETLAFIKTNGA